MVDQRILLIGGVSLVKGRVKEAGIVMKEICDELEPLLQEMEFVKSASFKTVSMIIRFGEKNDFTPRYESINKRYSELPVSVEIEMASLKIASKDIVKSAFVKITIDVLLDVAHQYNLPAEPLEEIKFS